MSDELQKLRKQFLDLKWTYNVEIMQELQGKMEKYLESYKDTEFKTLENTIYLLKALINQAETDDTSTSYKLALPMLENLEFGDDDYLLQFNYTRKLLEFSIPICEDYNQSLRLIKAVERNLDRYPEDDNTEEDFKRSMYIRMTGRLLNAKAFENLSKEELIKVEWLFKEYIIKARALCADVYNSDSYSILLVREGLFYGDRSIIDIGTYMARGIKKPELYAIIENYLDRFLTMPALSKAAPTIHERFGLKLRKLRSEKGVKLGELSKATGVASGTLRMLEFGEDRVKPPTLKKICEALGVDENYFSEEISNLDKEAAE
ncbi:MAG: helix-turn-helix transcriptional regulator [Defluviitaleaceae bacterium]|nr:helix-turn-helix transcriptional regulator [Defluviitaleaceae bacterium]